VDRRLFAGVARLNPSPRGEHTNHRRVSIMSKKDGSSNKPVMTPEEEKKNNRFSFIVGIFIAMAIIVLFSIFFH
jgi:capsular polysaccharide biosynthesis protein